MVFSRRIIETLQDSFGMLKNYTVLSEILTRLIFILVAFALFLIVYKFIPGHKITLKSQVWGALFASIALNIISLLASYINVFNYSITYGSLTTLFTIMIWIYFVFYVIFFGAEINKFLGLKKKEDKNKKGALE